MDSLLITGSDAEEGVDESKKATTARGLGGLVTLLCQLRMNGQNTIGLNSFAACQSCGLKKGLESKL